MEMRASENLGFFYLFELAHNYTNYFSETNMLLSFLNSRQRTGQQRMRILGLELLSAALRRQGNSLR